MKTPTITTASVRVMRSYDYNHFEITLGTSESATPEEVDSLRKEASRLADKAVKQYQIAKASAEREARLKEVWRLKQAQETPEGERSSAEKAIIKYHDDAAFAARFHYDYEDDFEPEYDPDED
jgi:hypothetical protein